MTRTSHSTKGSGPGHANLRIGGDSAHQPKYLLRGPLRSQIIRLPSLHHLLDGLALCNFFVQHLARQLWQLRVTCKAQADQLPHGEFPYARLQIRWQPPLKSQPLLQPNDPILHRQRHHPRAQESEQQSQRQQYALTAVPPKSRRIPTVAGPEKIDNHHRHNEKVKRRNKSPVIRKILLSHKYTPSCAPDCSKAPHNIARANLAPLFSVVSVDSARS